MCHGHSNRQPRHRRDREELHSPQRPGDRGQAGGFGRGVHHASWHLVRGARTLGAQRGGAARSRAPRCRTSDNHRDGQDLRVGKGRGLQVCLGASVVRRARRKLPGRREGLHRRRHRQGDLQADGRCSRRDAVELPSVAGYALRGTGANGRQRRAAEAFLERSSDCAADRRPLPSRRVPARGVPDLAHRLGEGGASPRGPTCSGCHDHGFGGGRPCGGRSRRKGSQEVSPRAWRERPFHSDPVGRSRAPLCPWPSKRGCRTTGRVA